MATDTKQDLLSDLDDLAGKATARPWANYNGQIYSDAPEFKNEVRDVGQPATDADSDFILALVNAYPAIRDRLIAAEAVAEAAHHAFNLVDNKFPYIPETRQRESVAFGIALEGYRAKRGEGT